MLVCGILSHIFQSTCLREARLKGFALISVTIYFNPRAYVRHDLSVLIMHLHRIFQSTCLREARRSSTTARPHAADFNPRAYVRHDTICVSSDTHNTNFNPRAYVRHDIFFIP